NSYGGGRPYNRNN
nr:Chain B, RNA-binding protein Rsf1-like [Spodoptera aff. frugiperda 2 BOLD-2017]